MRTTVEIRDDQRERLAAMAARRGLRGYSKLIEEALDQYLPTPNLGPTRRERTEAFLALRGSISDEQADHMRAVLREMREGPWRTPSSQTPTS